jgi:hypothetical protein
MNLVPFSHETSLRIAVSPSAKSGKDFLQSTSSLCISCSIHYTCKCTWLETGCYRSFKLQLTTGENPLPLITDRFICMLSNAVKRVAQLTNSSRNNLLFLKKLKSSCKIGGLDKINKW